MRRSHAMRNFGGAIAAGALALGLSGCDQIQSLWKSEKTADAPTPAAPAPVVQAPQPAPAVQVASAPEPAKPAESPSAAGDASLATKVKTALNGDPRLKALGIDVGVADGVVTLYGTADTRARREHAAKVASSVAGVKSVKNEMVIVAGS